MPVFGSTSSSSDLISGRKFLFGGIGVFILILGVMLAVYLILSPGSESFVLDRTSLFAGRNNLAQNLEKLVKDDLTLVDLSSDLRNDTIFGIINCTHCNTDFTRLKKGQVASQFWVAQEDCNDTTRISNAITQLDVIKRMINKYSDYLQLVRTYNDLEEAHENNKLASLMLVDQVIVNSTAFLRFFYDVGVRAMTLGSGCNDSILTDYIENDGKLTDFGKLYIEEMNRLGIMIDIQYLSSPVQQQVLNISRAPVMISHAAASSLQSHSENVDNSTLTSLKNNSGLLMITFDAPYLGTNENISMSDVIKHLNYITDIIGFDNIAIGGNYDSIHEKPQGLEDVSDFPNLFKELKKEKSLKWTADNLDKLAGLNFKRFFQDVEKAKKQ